MRFDLTDMRIFLSVVERGSLTHGAQAMNLSLAAVSERVTGMEAALGAPLLERAQRGVRPTAAGDALVRHARQILGQVEQMRGDLRRYATGLKGRLRLMSNTAALAAFLPERLCRFLTAYPDLSVDIDEKPTTEIIAAIAERRADLGVIADIADAGALITHPLANDQLVVVAAADHPVASLDAVPFAQIVDEPLVGLADGALETHLAERASRIGKQLHYRVQLRSVEQVGRMVASGVGLAILSEASTAPLGRPVRIGAAGKAGRANRTPKPGALAVVRLSEPWATRRLMLCARDFDALPPQLQLLAQELRAT